MGSMSENPICIQIWPYLITKSNLPLVIIFSSKKQLLYTKKKFFMKNFFFAELDLAKSFNDRDFSLNGFRKIVGGAFFKNVCERFFRWIFWQIDFLAYRPNFQISYFLNLGKCELICVTTWIGFFKRKWSLLNPIFFVL